MIQTASIFSENRLFQPKAVATRDVGANVGAFGMLAVIAALPRVALSQMGLIRVA